MSPDPQPATTKRQAELILFGATFFWGGTFVVIKWGLADISPLLLIALRFSLATLILLAVFHRAIMTIDRRAFFKGAALGLMLFTGYATQTLGLQYTTVSKSAFITGLMVIFTPVFQVWIERRRPDRANLIGVAVVSVGLWLLTNPVAGGFNKGDALTLLCAAVFGLYIVYLDIFTKAHSVAHLTACQLAVCAAAGWIFSWGLESPRFSPTPNAMWALAYLGVLGTFATTLIQTSYQKFTSPTRAAIIFTVEPVWAALTGYWFLQERIGWTGAAGGALIIAGILVSESRRSQPMPAKRRANVDTPPAGC